MALLNLDSLEYGDRIVLELVILYAAGAPIGDRLELLSAVTPIGQWAQALHVLNTVDDVIFNARAAGVVQAERVMARLQQRADRLAPSAVHKLPPEQYAELLATVERDLEQRGVPMRRTCDHCPARHGVDL